ncbi:MAG: trypsin-like peptidase domain-containing protein, partial [Planctomycetaceae bacterium]|nr:trypsin-like peptidase domain-containing protein [Planctomycetaceae bacterium]
DRSPQKDLVVVKINAPKEKLRPIAIGTSADLQVGQNVYAIGNPFGLDQTLTTGVISGLGRQIKSRSGQNIDDVIQTDAAINPGNSGGPLINLQGEVIGINTAIASNSGGNEGVGFSIPSNLVRKVMEELLEYGRVQRAYLGVKLDSNFDAATAARLKLDRPQGARVVEIYPNTPAERARLRADDVVIRFNNEIVQDENHLINLVSLAPLNKEIETVLIREGRKMTLPVVLSDREELQQRAVAPEDPSKGYPVQELGLTVHQLDAETAGSLGYPAGSTGLLVVKIEPGSQLDSKLRRYDLIEEAARTPLNSVGDLQQVLEERSRETIVLKVKRKGPNGIETHMIVLK